jgi:hypothetical protein
MIKKYEVLAVCSAAGGYFKKLDVVRKRGCGCNYPPGARQLWSVAWESTFKKFVAKLALIPLSLPIYRAAGGLRQDRGHAAESPIETRP